MRKNGLPAKVINRLFRLFYWPICRFYGRHFIGDKPADTVFIFLCSLQFYRMHHFWPTFKNPQHFTEKVWYRMFYERNPLFTLISDKLRVREYVKNLVGDAYLTELLWTGDDPEDIPFDMLPIKFVAKTNHGCGTNIMVKDKSTLDPTKTKRQLKKWLLDNYCLDKYLGTEWGYKNIKPTIIIEEFLEEKGRPPVDYKFYCFSGRVEFLTVHFDRFREHKTKAFSRNFEPYNFRYDFKNWEGDCPRPQNFDKMISLAESLSSEFNFIRVDLYSISDRIYFGELTAYPGGVSTEFRPMSTDRALGEQWKNRDSE